MSNGHPEIKGNSSTLNIYRDFQSFKESLVYSIMNMNNKSKHLIKTNYLHVRVVDIKEIYVITQLIGNEDMNTITLLQVTFYLCHLKHT